MKKFTKLFLSCAAVAALTAAVATSAMAAELKGQLAGSTYEDGKLTIAVPTDMDPAKAATLLVVKGDGTTVEAANVEAIDQAEKTDGEAKIVAFDKTGLKSAPTEGKYKVMLGYYDTNGKFKKATSNLFGSDVKIGDVDLNNRISSGDASLILEHTVGSTVLEGDAATAADVDGNGRISSGDASCILSFTVGVTDPNEIGNIVVE